MFNFESIAHAYANQRFPRASELEREKLIRDWVEKLEKSVGIVADIKRRIVPYGATLGGAKVLDAGCGNGGTSIVLSQNGALVSGVDIEPELVSIAQSLAVNCGVKVDFQCYDGIRLPYGDSSFDLAVSLSVLEHTTDPAAYLTEISRVLKPGGILYLAFPNRLWPKETHTQLWFISYLPRWLADAVVRFLGRNPLGDNNLHFISYRQLRKILAQVARVGMGAYSILPEPGTSQAILKRVGRLALRLLGIPYRALLPHVNLLLRKES